MALTPEALDAWRRVQGYTYARRLPDGSVVAVAPLTYGRARIIHGDLLSIYNGW